MFSVLSTCCNGVTDYIHHYDDLERGHYDKVICSVVSVMITLSSFLIMLPILIAEK